MKKFNFLFGAMLLLAIVGSCKKDEAVDERDKFVGTWKGTTTTSVPDLSINDTKPITLTISKNKINPKQLDITDGEDSYTAIVNGNTYTYNDFTWTGTIELEDEEGNPYTVTASYKMTGTGSINGSSITESGTIRLFVVGEEYPGAWSRTLVKQ